MLHQIVPYTVIIWYNRYTGNLLRGCRFFYGRIQLTLLQGVFFFINIIHKYNTYNLIITIFILRKLPHALFCAFPVCQDQHLFHIGIARHFLTKRMLMQATCHICCNIMQHEINQQRLSGINACFLYQKQKEQSQTVHSNTMCHRVQHFPQITSTNNRLMTGPDQRNADIQYDQNTKKSPVICCKITANTMSEYIANIKCHYNTENI